jgi:hypothetical protein
MRNSIFNVTSTGYAISSVCLAVLLDVQVIEEDHMASSFTHKTYPGLIVTGSGVAVILRRLKEAWLEDHARSRGKRLRHYLVWSL